MGTKLVSLPSGVDGVWINIYTELTVYTSDEDDDEEPLVRVENEFPLVRDEDEFPLVRDEDEEPLVRDEDDDEEPLVRDEDEFPLVRDEDEAPLVRTSSRRFEKSNRPKVDVKKAGLMLTDRDVEDPDVEDPDVEDPDVEDPDVENPDVEDPGVEDPDVENPDVEDPEAKKRSMQGLSKRVHELSSLVDNMLQRGQSEELGAVKKLCNKVTVDVLEQDVDGSENEAGHAGLTAGANNSVSGHSECSDHAPICSTSSNNGSALPSDAIPTDLAHSTQSPEQTESLDSVVSARAHIYEYASPTAPGMVPNLEASLDKTKSLPQLRPLLIRLVQDKGGYNKENPNSTSSDDTIDAQVPSTSGRCRSLPKRTSDEHPITDSFVNVGDTIENVPAVVEEIDLGSEEDAPLISKAVCKGKKSSVSDKIEEVLNQSIVSSPSNSTGIVSPQKKELRPRRGRQVQMNSSEGSSYEEEPTIHNMRVPPKSRSEVAGMTHPDTSLSNVKLPATPKSPKTRQKVTDRDHLPEIDQPRPSTSSEHLPGVDQSSSSTSSEIIEPLSEMRKEKCVDQSAAQEEECDSTLNPLPVDLDEPTFAEKKAMEPKGKKVLGKRVKQDGPLKFKFQKFAQCRKKNSSSRDKDANDVEDFDCLPLKRNSSPPKPSAQRHRDLNQSSPCKKRGNKGDPNPAVSPQRSKKADSNQAKCNSTNQIKQPNRTCSKPSPKNANKPDSKKAAVSPSGRKPNQGGLTPKKKTLDQEKVVRADLGRGINSEGQKESPTTGTTKKNLRETSRQEQSRLLPYLLQGVVIRDGSEKMMKKLQQKCTVNLERHQTIEVLVTRFLLTRNPLPNRCQPETSNQEKLVQKDKKARKDSSDSSLLVVRKTVPIKRKSKRTKTS